MCVFAGLVNTIKRIHSINTSGGYSLKLYEWCFLMFDQCVNKYTVYVIPSGVFIFCTFGYQY